MPQVRIAIFISLAFNSYLPQNAVLPLVIFGHEQAVVAEPAKPEGDEMPGIVDDGLGRDEEMAVVLHAVLHEQTMLEMGIEGFLLLQFAALESEHV